jgi:hypothetical protein
MLNICSLKRLPLSPRITLLNNFRVPSAPPYAEKGKDFDEFIPF